MSNNVISLAEVRAKDHDELRASSDVFEQMLKIAFQDVWADWDRMDASGFESECFLKRVIHIANAVGRGE